MISLEDRFNNFAMEAGVLFGSRQYNLHNLWNGIVSLYTEKDRYYHTLSHIEHCYREYDKVRNLLEFPTAVEAAILFHDAIYDTHNHDNEEKSAEAAAGSLDNIGANFPGLSRVPWLIMATAHKSKPINSDAQYLQDIDLAILGAEENDFLLYDGNIQNEYLWVPEVEFLQARAKFLNKLIPEHGYIYNTWHFINKYEMQAKLNIKMVCELYNRRLMNMGVSVE